MRNPLGPLIRTAARTVTVPVALTATVTTSALGLGYRVATVPARRLGEILPNPRSADGVLAVSKEVLGAEPGRRYWQGPGRYYIEVRGLETEQGPAVASAVLAAVRSAPGVLSARLNVPLARVIVSVDDPGPSMRALCKVVTDAEAQARPVPARGAQRPRDLPADGVVLTGQLMAAAANAAGLCTALAGRILLWPALPASLTASVILVDYQPRLRGRLEDRLGGNTTNTALALASAAVYTLTQAPVSLAVETVRHVVQVGEGIAGAQAWQRQESALSEHIEDTGTATAPRRPVPLPPGPIERHAQRSSVAQGFACAAGLLAGNINAGATAAVVTAPRAARNAREGFAATLGRGLADRHDMIALHPRALRRLDRIDAVVLDPRALMLEELRVSRLRGVPDRDRAHAWRWAHEQLQRGALSPGWHRVPTGAGRYNGHAGEVFIRHAHHPLAAGVLGEIRRAGAEAVSADVDELDDLRSSFADLPAVGGSENGSVDAALCTAVETLQRDGHTVALVTTGATRTLSSADLSIGLLTSEGRPPWRADLLVHDLAGVWRILHALPAARKASLRGVEIATSASILGALLMIPGVAGQGPGPVTAGAAAGLVNGLWLARGVLADAAPAPEVTLQWHAMSPGQVRAELPPPQRQAPQARSKLSTTASASAGVIGAVAGPVGRLAAELSTAVRAELSDPLTPVLAVGSAASALLGSPVDAVLVASVLTVNALLAASQQVRAERLLRRLLAVQDPPARLVTDDGYDTVEAAQLRPGDLIEVRPGEVVPADARIVAASDLEVDESSLTGESLPVPKQVEATPGAELADRSCMLYAGTTVAAGTASALVTATGAQTQARRAADVTPAEGSAVGLQGQLRDLTNRALPFSVAGGAVVSGLGLLRLVPLLQAVASGVAVSVAAVPEGLPLVATLAQQASARRLTRAGALVRTPRSVEALGRVDVVCFDKTGTLSKNQLHVSQVFTASGFSAEQVLVCAAVATAPKNGDHHEHATDAAVVAASDAHPPTTNGDTAHLPFRSGRPFSASLVETELLVKGAPEVLLAACADLDPHTQQVVREMAESGLRVIAVARRTVTAEQSRAARESDDVFAELCGSGLQFAGLLGLSDTPREESAAVLVALREQQIGIRLITGDHPVTATAIAAELGLPVTADQVISGTEWAALPRRGQEQAVRDRVVFARMTPEHKVQVVQTLERIGQVCAMVGDGANDAAAIRSATVGIGVASRGSDPARTAADVMLLDGRIGALLDAVDEGRQLWCRVQSAVAVLLGGNAGEVAFAIVGSALTGRSPLNTRQLLLVNMMTDALPAAALAVSPATRTTGNSGRGPDQAALWRTVAIRGTTTAAAATSAWLLAGFTLRPRRASTVALVSLVGTQLGQTLIDSHSPLVVTTAVGSLVTLGALISTPGVSQLLGCTPLGPVGWAQALTTAGIATTAAAVAPRLLTGVQSSISSIPSRHSTAYSSASPISKARETTLNGSGVATVVVDDTSTTMPTANV